MRKEKIFIKHRYAKDSCWYSPHEYNIYRGTERIGFINFTIKNKILVIGYIGIELPYRNMRHGYKTIEYLLSHYKVKCIVGQSLTPSRSFWNKCIKRFDGQRRNISTMENCTSSFVIPKYRFSDSDLKKLLDIGHEIE